MSYAETLSSEAQPEPFSVSDLAILTARKGVVLVPSTREKKYNTPRRHEYGIWDEDKATVVGLISLYPGGEGSLETAYDVEPKYRGQGYASLALVAIANHTKNKYHLKTEAIVGFGNAASQGVARKAGFEVTDVAGSVMVFTDQMG